VKILVHHKRKNIVIGSLKKKVLRRLFEPKREEVTGRRGKLCSEELHDMRFHPILSCSPTKCRWKKGVGHVAHMGEKKVCVNCWLENLEKRKYLKFEGGRIILK
jgi:hypothetical protein